MPLRNAPSAAAARLASIGGRLRGEVPPIDAPQTDAGTLAARLRTATAALSPAPAVHAFTVRPKPVRWLDTGLVLRRGQQLTLVAQGAVHVLRALRVSMPAKAVLWWRVGDGELHAAAAECATLTADADGPLQLAALPPGSFDDRHGSILPSPLHLTMSGSLTVGVVLWQQDAATALETAAAADPPLIGPALQRLRQPVQPPQGWHYLWRLGEGEIYCADDGDEICCHTDGDVGILQYPLDLPFADGLQLGWSWRAERLPSTRAEHIDLTHDYLSLAVAFDNGLDLTWMWSAKLAPGTVFQCPLPWWKERETHWVLRNAQQDALGAWLEERRDIGADYDIAIGGPRPQRVVGVWLIANSLFQRREGLCRYRDIRLWDAQRDIRLHPSQAAPSG